MDHIKLTSPHDTVNNPYLAAFLFSIRNPFLLLLFGLLDIHIQACAKRTLFAKLVQKWHFGPPSRMP
ncbi:hypothetical protein TRIATDRAFT_257502 [Trichoderma atroviride IMI 206040]|uniref:Uncharacterized protein n=1 Tax=Hypocrea atroviridis (strain ATCC 20476 / IMI 206040) TaxID=452589 RepID=G9NYM6_HYPAI|nr:uncharacterized protein TRIATDRAFT_257502 [Trichoderma atroviride IMI 206040]EHK43700.1 hypothetical protein TRIATDRAFT_257502 [Trichoderma atroviride IMI 206040]